MRRADQLLQLLPASNLELSQRRLVQLGTLVSGEASRSAIFKSLIWVASPPPLARSDHSMSRISHREWRSGESQWPPSTTRHH